MQMIMKIFTKVVDTNSKIMLQNDTDDSRMV